MRLNGPCFINCLLIIRPLFDTQLPNGYYPYFQQLSVKVIAVTFLTKKWTPAKFICVQTLHLNHMFLYNSYCFFRHQKQVRIHKTSSSVLKLSLTELTTNCSLHSLYFLFKNIYKYNPSPSILQSTPSSSLVINSLKRK